MDGRKADDEYTYVQRNGSIIGLQYNTNEWQQAGRLVAMCYHTIIIMDCNCIAIAVVIG